VLGLGIEASNLDFMSTAGLFASSRDGYLFAADTMASTVIGGLIQLEAALIESKIAFIKADMDKLNAMSSTF